MIYIYQLPDDTRMVPEAESWHLEERNGIGLSPPPFTNFLSLKVVFSEGHHTGLIETLNSFWLEESESLGQFSPEKWKEARESQTREPNIHVWTMPRSLSDL